MSAMTTFRVRGVHQQAMYDVLVQPGQPSPFVGSSGLRTLFGLRDGTELTLHDGRVTVVDTDDPWSLLALLTVDTQVLHVGAGAPTAPPSARQ